MSLLRVAEPEPPAQRWLPTHVQVTVLQARGLRTKGGGGGGKPGTSDAYTIIQLGREKYSTSVAEKSTGSPEWKEECSFELPPGALELGEPADWGGGSPRGQGGCELVLTVMHRALIGLDKFLGQATVALQPVFRESRSMRSQWHKLHSKAGKKEKERGAIQVTIQFTRNNLTASMFDLSMKDKPRSPFGKLKDKMKGKKKYDLESASAIIPSSTGALDMEEDYELGGKKSKGKGGFFKNKLRKSSLTQSNTSLGSDSTISSASGSLANNFGITINVPEVTKSPSRHSSLSTERSVKDYLPSPKLTHKRAFSDEISQVNVVAEPKAIQSPKPKDDPVSRSSLCVNGSHVYSDEPAPKSPMSGLPSSLPLSLPLQNIARKSEEGFHAGFPPPDSEDLPWGVRQQKEEPRFLPSPPSLAVQEENKVSTKAVTLSNHLGRAKLEEGSRLETKPVQIATPMVFSMEVTKDKSHEETRKEDKKSKVGLFHHGGTKGDAGNKSLGEKLGSSLTISPQVTAAGDEKSKSSSWFGSKDTKEPSQKPSLEVSPKVETSSDAPSHFSPCSPVQCPPAAIVHPARMLSTNLLTAAEESQFGCLSPTNPFLHSLHSNPFFEDLLADQVLNSPSPTHFFSSFQSGSHATKEVVGHLYSSEDYSPSASLGLHKPQQESSTQSAGAPIPEATPTSQGLSPPREQTPATPPVFDWDDTFDAFATSRLKPEIREESLLNSVVMEDVAYIDDPSPTGSPAELVHENQIEKAKVEPQGADEVSLGPGSWADVTILKEREPNVLKTVQEATRREDGVLDHLGSLLESEKTSTSQAWSALGASGKEEDAAALTTQNSAREKWDSETVHVEKLTVAYSEEEPNSAGEDEWTTTATETIGGLWESDQTVAEKEHEIQESMFRPRPPSDEGIFEEESSPVSAPGLLTKSNLVLEKPSEVLPRNKAALSLLVSKVEAAEKPSAVFDISDGQDSSNTEGMVDIKPPGGGLQTSAQLEADEASMKLGSDFHERQIPSAVWTETPEREEESSGAAGLEITMGAPPPKPPRWFTPWDFREEDDEANLDTQMSQQGNEYQCENEEGPKVAVQPQYTHVSRENVSPVAPSPPVLGAAIIEAKASCVPSVAGDADSATEDWVANLKARANEFTKRDTSSGENLLEINEETGAEQFETCPSKFSLDRLGLSDAEEDSNKLEMVKPSFHPQSQQLTERRSGAGWGLSETAPAFPERKEILPEQLIPSKPDTPRDPESSQSVLFCTAVEEQWPATHYPSPSPADQLERLALQEHPSQPRPKSGKGDNQGHLGKAPAQPAEREPQTPEVLESLTCASEQGSYSADRPEPLSSQRLSWSVDQVIDFKKAEFWRPVSGEESREQADTSTLGNPFTPRVSPSSPNNPFVEKPPDVLPIQATSPEMPGQGGLNFKDLHKEAAPHGFQPANLPGDQLVELPFLHGNQPLAFSTPSLVAATNPQQFNFPSPIVCPTTGGVPAVTSRAAAQSSCPLLQTSGMKVSTLTVLPKETQPAEKPSFHQTSSPHPVKPISAAVAEVSGEKKQHRSTLTTALSSGLEKLKTVTTSSVQPVTPSSQLEKMESKKLKDAALPDQSAKYYHLTHDELIQLLLQREKELSRKEEHVHELENYIDQLLVRIMEQSPTLLQIPLEKNTTSK
ncbi:rab11 family-interacting protein 5 isoform X1 [Chelonia mydas]|uniref:rab11 family-interacting protein 5 isoform X1 n=1 Tax=Chelonia mydas TaxID=8469 RepID=UPI001CA9081A|nr:rab11 family-interacting protein 5 isoform X1 [Chelonia mydas]